MEITGKEMRQNKVRQKRMRRVKEIDYHAAYLPEMTCKERRSLRKKKMKQKKKREENVKAVEEEPKHKKMRREENDKADEKKRMTKLPIRRAKAAAASYLPEELVIESILTKLPIRTLAQYFSCISKSWYNSIFNDIRFAKTHYHKLNLVLVLLNVWFAKAGASFLSFDHDYKFKLFLNYEVVYPKQFNKTELVGYCDGLACVTQMRKDAYGPNWMTVMNPVRKETLSLAYNYPSNNGECEYLCHGFGFDSSADEYKVVIIFTSKDNEEELISMVFTLGSNSWRTSVAHISPPPGSSPFASRLVTRLATLCGGDLFWRITNNHTNVRYVRGDNKISMLLSFDIHKEKIQFIQIPAERSLTPTPDVVVEHHLLEHKGYPCFAQSEKAMTNILHRSCLCRNDVCCCGCRFKVQLYVLKDKEKQLWIKGETLGVQVKELGLPPPAPFCCCFDSYTDATVSFPTRILSVSDQVLFYWFDGKCLKLYNLQTKHLEVVESSSSSHRKSRRIFLCKMSRSPPLEGFDGCFDADGINLYCPYMDFQLHVQPENILSLKTFIPAGETSRCKYNCLVQEGVIP